MYRALRQAEPEETSVARVCLQNGAWELGRVAARFRELFGELPSETVRRKPSAIHSAVGRRGG
ncbi:MAG: hypothetical protein JRE81_11500 [Deltaproteobacteria bacterium]|nr:hypothetical protein [Deltaproteobacteria bacterium]